MTAEFDRHNAAYPEVYEMFKRLALTGHRRGFKRMSADGIFHDIRQEMGPGFHLNNNLTSHYARKFLEDHQHMEGFFELRPAKADRNQEDPRQMSIFAMV